MKKYILMFGLTLVMGLFISNTLVAQQGWLTSPPNYSHTTDWVGIGTTTPGADFHLRNASDVADFRISRPLVGNGAVGRFRIINETNGDILNFVLRVVGGETEQVQSGYHAATNTWLEYAFLNYNTGLYEFRTGIQELQFRNSGNVLFNNTGAVGIGVPINDVAKLAGAKLAVNGKIVSTEVEVKLYGSWPDFVFQDDFNLMPLNELESFISTNRHLPGVPTEAHVTENGVNLGQMTGILLQKVEEMTLHIIDLNKRIAELEGR